MFFFRVFNYFSRVALLEFCRFRYSEFAYDFIPSLYEYSKKEASLTHHSRYCAATIHQERKLQKEKSTKSAPFRESKKSYMLHGAQPARQRLSMTATLYEWITV